MIRGTFAGIRQCDLARLGFSLGNYVFARLERRVGRNDQYDRVDVQPGNVGEVLIFGLTDSLKKREIDFWRNHRQLVAVCLSLSAFLVTDCTCCARSVDHHNSVRQVPADCVGQCTRSEEHTSELKSLMRISYAVFCLKKK